MVTTTSGGIPSILKGVRGERRKQDMAETLGVTPASYGRWERGEHPFPAERLPWLSEASGVALDDLEAAWRLDYANRALKRASSEGDSPGELLTHLVEQQGQIAQVLSDLVGRLDRLERSQPAKPVRAGARKRGA